MRVEAVLVFGKGRCEPLQPSPSDGASQSATRKAQLRAMM